MENGKKKEKEKRTEKKGKKETVEFGGAEKYGEWNIKSHDFTKPSAKSRYSFTCN